MQLWGIPVVQDRWKRHIADGFASGEIVPLPTHTYTPENAKEAFRFMSQGKHLGKVLIDMQDGVLPKKQDSSPSVRSVEGVKVVTPSIPKKKDDATIVNKYFTKG